MEKMEKEDFVKINECLSLARVTNVESDGLRVELLPGGEERFLSFSEVTKVDTNKLGKKHEEKVCNICHKVKRELIDFEANQTDKAGNIVTRPSCRECRENIDGVSMSTSEKKKWALVKPADGSCFSCPICHKSTIVNVTSKVVLDHDHTTGIARGWICDSCNTGMGRFKDDIIFLGSAQKHLVDHTIYGLGDIAVIFSKLLSSNLKGMSNDYSKTDDILSSFLSSYSDDDLLDYLIKRRISNIIK